MARLPNLTRDNVPAEFLEAFDEVTAETGGVITGGPGSITINSPEMARRRAYLTNYLRFESTFPKKNSGACYHRHSPRYGLPIRVECSRSSCQKTGCF